MAIVFRKRFLGTFALLFIVGFFGFFAGCSYDRRTDRILHEFAELEAEALEYGTVSVGAARVANYDRCQLRKSRERLGESLMSIRKDLQEKSVVPEGRVTNRIDTRKRARLQSNASGKDKGKTLPAEKCQAPDEKQPSGDADDPSPTVAAPTTGQAPQPSQIDMVGLRMAALKFIESEIEDLSLNEIIPVDCKNFRRVVVNLDCSAWVRGKARGVLVYIDLYPYRADRWCHKAAEILKEWRHSGRSIKRKREKAEEKWKRVTKEELGVAFECLDGLTIELPGESEIEEEEERGDWVSLCHRWLKKMKFFPRIVHVERMGKAEYLILAEADYLRSEFEIGAGLPAGLSAKVGVERRKETEQVRASIRPLSLAFVAGGRRAGWLFMPSKTKEGRMPPTERRLKMVVDVPVKSSKLAIHVHKVFLGPDLGILPGAAFDKQMANLKLARRKLTEADELYSDNKGKKTDRLSRAHYRLIKSRMRNLLYQGWSEEIVVDVSSSNLDQEKR